LASGVRVLRVIGTTGVFGIKVLTTIGTAGAFGGSLTSGTRIGTSATTITRTTSATRY